VAVAIWGVGGWRGAAAFGGVATGLQMVAAHAMARTGQAATLDHLKVYGLGMMLRMFAGLALMALAFSRDRTTFEPLPSALGYLGTVLPLLYLEIRLAR
jgi:uncharacterized membrane protein YgdD (TMEM256/DUF423 family)